MKILVETSGPFQLMNSAQEELIRSEGLTVVHKSQFWGEHLSEGRVLIRAQVNDEATDAEWLDTLRESDGDEELALASFLDRFPVTAASARAPEPKPVVHHTRQVEHNAKKGRQASGATPKQE